MAVRYTVAVSIGEPVTIQAWAFIGMYVICYSR
jgi:hypothetical protein